MDFRKNPFVTYLVAPALAGAVLLSACGGCGSKKEDEGDAGNGGPDDAAAAGATLYTPGADSATISGTVKFEGTAPERGKVSLVPECAKLHAGKDFLDEAVIANENGTLRNVYVWVNTKKSPALSGKKFAPATGKAQIDQQNCQYIPHVLGMRAGQDLDVKNSDNFSHNIHPAPKSNKAFNLIQPTKMVTTFTKSSKDKTFTREESKIEVKCDVHPHMRAYVHVSSHPYFAVTGEDGAFKLEGLPPGKYVVEAIHEKLGTQEMEVEVAAKESKTADFSFKAN